MTKLTLLSALIALLILPSIASAESTADFDTTQNATWLRVLTLAKMSDGESGHAQQTMVMNITALPEGGAKSRAVRSLVNPAQYYFQPSPFNELVIGENIVTIVAADFNRAVKVQFNSDAIEFDALTINGVDQLTAAAAQGTQGQGTSQPISQYSDIFAVGNNASYPAVATLALTGEGAPSLDEQTLVMNITYLPAGSPSYRVYKTLGTLQNNGNVASDTSPANGQALTLGVNTITVSAATFAGDIQSRTVKAQFSSNDIEFDALSINGVDQDLAVILEEGTQGNGQTISQTISQYPDIFDATTNPDYPAVAELVSNSRGVAVSGLEQTLVMNVTYIPAGGANYRVYQTNDPATGSGGGFGPAQALVLNENTITVPAVSYNRTVKIQFDNVDVEFDALSINEAALLAAGTQGIGQSISDSPNVFAPANATVVAQGWASVATLTTAADGLASQGVQTVVINVTYIPEGGATYRINRTVASGVYNSDEPVGLVVGENTITVDAVDYDRAVKLQLSSDAFEFDALTINGVNQLAVTIANSNLFNAGPDATWVAVLTTAVSQDGTSSRSQQTVVLNVTSLPAVGANYRVYQTSASGGGGGGAGNGSGGGGGVPTTSLVVGENTITVDAVGFDRSVKIEFDSDAVEYDALSVNGAARTIGADAVAVPSVSINGSTLTWTEADGTTLQFSDDLESWTSLPSATSPYSPSTTPDRFYRMISEEEE